MSEEPSHRLIAIENKNYLAIQERGINSKIFSTNTNIVGDWRKELEGCLEDPSGRTPHRIRIQA